MPDEPKQHPNAEPFRETRAAATPGLNAANAYEKFLDNAIAELKPESKHMRGMQRLSNVTQTVLKDMDAKADAVADRIVAGQARAAQVIEKFGNVADAIETTANEVESALAQFSNDPTQVSGGS